MRLTTLLAIASLLLVARADAQWGDHLWVSASNGSLYRLDSTGALHATIVSGGAGQGDTVVSSVGDVFFALPSSGRVFRTRADGTISTLLAIGAAPSGLAIDRNGRLWVTDAAAGEVHRCTIDGAVLTTITRQGETGFGPVAASRNGHVWFASTTNTIYQYDDAGTPVRFLASAGQNLVTLALDPSGACWALDRGPQGSLIQYDAATGEVRTARPIAHGRDFAVNAYGEVYVLTDGQLSHYANSGLWLRDTMLPGNGHTSVGLDIQGDVWVVRNGDTLAKYDRFTLAPLATVRIPGATGLRLHGDPSGYTMVAMAGNAQTDRDGDAAADLTEAYSGSDPTDAASTPTTPRPVVSGVARPGATVYLTLRQSTDAFAGFAVGGSANVAPGIPVPNTNRTIPLAPGAFYWLVARSGAVVHNRAGNLDANGDAHAWIRVPNAPALIGQKYHFAFITLDYALWIPVSTISSPVAITVR